MDILKENECYTGNKTFQNDSKTKALFCEFLERVRHTKNLSKTFCFGNTLHRTVHFDGVILLFFHQYFFSVTIEHNFFRWVRAPWGPVASWSWGSCGRSPGWQGGSRAAWGHPWGSPRTREWALLWQWPWHLDNFIPFTSSRDDNSACLSLLEPIGFFILITEATKSRLYPPF